jgi:hypothetical protein
MELRLFVIWTIVLFSYVAAFAGNGSVGIGTARVAIGADLHIDLPIEDFKLQGTKIFDLKNGGAILEISQISKPDFQKLAQSMVSNSVPFQGGQALELQNPKQAEPLKFKWVYCAQSVADCRQFHALSPSYQRIGEVLNQVGSK